MFERELLAVLRASWVVLETVKPTRTIDELGRLTSGLWNLYAQGDQPLAQEVPGQLAAAKVAKRAVVRHGGDQQTLAAASEHVAVYEELLAPSVPPRDTLAGSLNAIARREAVIGEDDPALLPVSQHGSVRVLTRGALRAAAGLAGQPPRLGEARARLQGQTDALRRVDRALQESHADDNALQGVLNTRLHAVQAAALMLSGPQRRRLQAPAPPSTAGPPAAAARKVPRRRSTRAKGSGGARHAIEIEPAEDPRTT